MTDYRDLKYQIAFSMLKGVGTITAKTLLTHFGTPENLFNTSEQELKKNGVTQKIIESLQCAPALLARAEKEIEFVKKKELQTTFITESSYPFRLKECVDAPILLYSKGNIGNLNARKMLAIVGTRRITEYGKKVCRDLVEEISQKYPDAVIVSGLAYGADGCAHKSAIEFGLKTVGIVAHGLDIIYPPAHVNLVKKMLEHDGSVCTEFLTETNPDRQNFVKRNRIVAGLCDATIVIESGEKGGSLITAEIASSYNRDVLAFPGRKGDEFSAGCNKLIKTNKAAMIESVEDLEYVLGWESKIDFSKQIVSPDLFAQMELTADEQRIFELLKRNETLHINQLSIEMGLPMSKISPLLVGLEFKGIVKCLPGSMYKVI